MDERRLGYAVLGVLALVVLALAGSTLTTTVDPGGDTGVGEAEEDPATEIGVTPPRFDFVMYLVFGTLVLLAVGATYGLLRQPLETLRGIAQTVFAGVVVVAMVLLALFLMQSGESPEAPPEGEGVNNSTGGEGTGTGEGEGVGGGAEDAVDRLTESPELLVLGGLALLTLGVIAAAIMASEPGERDHPVDDGDDPQDALAAIGRVAGEAADRLEGTATVDNEVYRAWKRMTELLDVDDPDVRTPGEFRNAAVGAGMAPDDVSDLTRLFEDVRYGGHEVTDERERRAIEDLRAIEAAYADDADPADGTASDDRRRTNGGRR